MFNFLGSNVLVTLQNSNTTPADPADALFVTKAEETTRALGQRPLPAKHAPSHHSVFMVPFHRDPNFLGRRSTLELIDQTLSSQPSVALSGLGGIG
jgi:hypothetical protein